METITGTARLSLRFTRLLAPLFLLGSLAAPITLSHTQRAHAAAVPVSLANLAPDTSQGIQVLTTQIPGHFHQSPLTQGLQLGDRDAYVEYALDGRYTTLAGTLYGDDNSNNTATILIVDATQRNPVVLLRVDVPPAARQQFHVVVRGVGHLMIEQVKCCGIAVDVVASLTSWPGIPVRPVTGTALDATTEQTAKDSQPLTLAAPGHFSGLLLVQGFQLNDKDAYVGYALHGAYTTLSGVLYADDNSNNTATIVIVDTTARVPRVLFRTDVPQGARKPFALSVRGVGQLMIEQTQCCGIAVDVVASMARGRRVPPPVMTGTALEATPIDSSQGSQLLTLDTPGHFTGVLITAGFQLGDSGAYAAYLLQRHDTILSGMLYGDDSSNNPGTIAIEDTSGTTPRLLGRFAVPQGVRRAFQIVVRGVGRLTIVQTQCCGVAVDVVATLTG